MYRAKLIFGLFFLATLVVVARLFYWQIVNAKPLQAQAQNQYWFAQEISPIRGKICTSDNFCLVSNETFYLIFAFLPQLKEKPKEVAAKLAPFFQAEDTDSSMSSPSGQLSSSIHDQHWWQEKIEKDLSSTDKTWIPLKHNVSRQTKEAIESLHIEGINFETEEKRFYPEASMAAQLLGFLGSDINGNPAGYFGLEGFYNGQLKGYPGKVKEEKDPSGRPILIGDYRISDAQSGSTLILNLERAVQFIVEKRLVESIKKYGARAGSVVVLNPKTGAILAMASYPAYNPAFFENFDKELYKNPIVANTYEPGSTFKVIVMAAALNEHVVKPETICDKCVGPRSIGGFTIKTWNDKYFPNSTMTEVLEHSDNVGMTFVGEKLGLDKFYQYLEAFGFGKPTGVDLQEDAAASLRQKKDWYPIDLLTASFGQGIAVTGMQMVQAVAAIAKEGKLMTPQIVKKIISSDR